MNSPRGPLECSDAEWAKLSRTARVRPTFKTYPLDPWSLMAAIMLGLMGAVVLARLFD
jgi:hypothetical protein